ncbi:MAG: hypothetical protein IAI50_13560 [Candidatus Eremiobacteraeota bacterium]|nr:hypothetical protein [Candidatus Eremiobacteraeota bacterium]
MQSHVEKKILGLLDVIALEVAELRSDVNELRGDVTALRSDVTALRSVKPSSDRLFSFVPCCRSSE